VNPEYSCHLLLLSARVGGQDARSYMSS